jgi:SAM-dependent methyltransferase
LENIAGMKSDNEKAVEEHFDGYAASHKWQDLYEKELNKDNVAFALRLDAYADLIRELQPGSVLDLGCGSGDYLPVIPAQTRYHGVDISAVMIRSVQEKIDQLPPERRAHTSCEVAAISEMSANTAYDFILASGFVEYFDDVAPIVEKMAALTNREGYVATQVPNRLYYKFEGVRHWQSEGKAFRHHRMTREECDEIHADVGLEKVRGFYFDHLYFPKSRKWFPKLHYILDSRFAKLTPENFSRKFATGYLGLYRKP